MAHKETEMERLAGCYIIAQNLHLKTMFFLCFMVWIHCEGGTGLRNVKSGGNQEAKYAQQIT